MIAENLDGAIARIEQARLEVSGHHIVKIVAISKYSTSKEIEELFSAGQRAFGENKVQDLTKKQEELEALPIEWHFVGSLQKNKINHLLKCTPSLIHSIDSLELALEIDKRCDKRHDALLQINSALEETKSGVHPESAIDIYQEIEERCNNLKLIGIMTIGAHTDDHKTIKKSFETTKKIYDSLQKNGAKILSMGMSSDFEVAIKCGSNMVRLGSTLFK